MNIRIAGVVNDSIVDGPGLRFAVFTQGCSHRCPGCHNPETHDPLGGHEEDTAALIARMKKNPLLSGITLTGGDPLEQSAPCLELAKAAHAMGWTAPSFRRSALWNWITAAAKTSVSLMRPLPFGKAGPFSGRRRFGSGRGAEPLLSFIAC